MQGIMSESKRKRLEAAIQEANRFLIFAKITLLRNSIEARKERYIYNMSEMGQIKRASLDLSRALTIFRRP